MATGLRAIQVSQALITSRAILWIPASDVRLAATKGQHGTASNKPRQKPFRHPISINFRHLEDYQRQKLHEIARNGLVGTGFLPSHCYMFHQGKLAPGFLICEEMRGQEASGSPNPNQKKWCLPTVRTAAKMQDLMETAAKCCITASAYV